MKHVIHGNLCFRTANVYIEDIDVPDKGLYRLKIDVDQTRQLKNDRSFLQVLPFDYIYNNPKHFPCIIKNKGAKKGECPYQTTSGPVPGVFTMSVSTRK